MCRNDATAVGATDADAHTNKRLITQETNRAPQIMDSHSIEFNSILIESSSTLPFHFQQNCISQNTGGERERECRKAWWEEEEVHTMANKQAGEIIFVID